MKRSALPKSQGKRAPKAKAYRFDARLTEEQKMLIERAANMQGRTMTDFVLHSAEMEAQRIIEQRTLLILSARDTEVFVNTILNPGEPGPVLREAARRYKKQMGH